MPGITIDGKVVECREKTLKFINIRDRIDEKIKKQVIDEARQKIRKMWND